VKVVKKLELSSIHERFLREFSNTSMKSFLLQNEKILMEVTAPKTLFTNTGEEAKFTVIYVNESNFEVKETRLELVRIDQGQVNDSVTSKNHIVQSAIFEGVAGKSTKTVETYFKITYHTPSSCEVCKVVKVYFEIHITAVIDTALNHTIKIPVFIKNV
jgi:hypothetical protein